MAKVQRKKSSRLKIKPVSPPPPLRARLSPTQARQRFRKLFSAALVRRWLRECPGSFYERLFTPLITLWYLVFQRLGDNHTLAQVLADAHHGGADALSPRGKPLSQGLQSAATASYSNARQGLPLKLLHRALAHSAREIRSWAQNTCWQDWNLILLDGSTVRLRSLGDIPTVFPPHRNSHGLSYWCLMRVVVGFCLNTGVAVATAMGACSVGEQALALPLLAQLGLRSLVVADRNFGIFWVAQAALDASVAVVVRLTESRARLLGRNNGLGLRRCGDRPVAWTASRHDRCDPKSPHQTVAGRLLACRVHRPGFPPRVIYLFTTLRDASAYTTQAVLDLYGRRWQVELNLRYLKTEMELGALECQSAEMAQKEWVAGLLAYNLVRSLMVAAATHAGLSLGTLSFTRTRQCLGRWLHTQGSSRQATAQSWERLLRLVAQCRQPRRSKPRPAEPRAKRYFKQDFLALKGSRSLARQRLRQKMRTKS